MFKDEAQLEAELTRPSDADTEFMRRLAGDIVILGAGGKMGPSLAVRARRATDRAGKPRRIVAVSRFSAPEARLALESAGVEPVACDLMDPAAVKELPSCENVIYMAGRKFGSSGRPDLTWAMNTLMPSRVAERYRGSRMVAFSTGNVYAFVEAGSGGSRETDPVFPVGEYAQSCVGRERVFEYVSNEHGTPCLLFRLNYAVDLRYGVLVDIARKVRAGDPVDLGVGWANVIWQGDANSYALRSLEHCQSPPCILNVTGPETLSVREVALFYGRRFGRPPEFRGREGATALLSDASKCHRLLGPPAVTAERLMEWVAQWLESGGRTLDKPTKFEVRDGKF